MSFSISKAHSTLLAQEQQQQAVTSSTQIHPPTDLQKWGFFFAEIRPGIFFYDPQLSFLT